MRRRAVRSLVWPLLALALACCARPAGVDAAALREAVGDAPVVLLSAAWCGYCDRQRDDFRRWGVAFAEYDIETSERGERAYDLLRARGVPIVLVGERRVHGYAPSRVRELLRDAGVLRVETP